MFFVRSVYFKLRNILRKSGTFLPGHPVYIYIYIYISKETTQVLRWMHHKSSNYWYTYLPYCTVLHAGSPYSKYIIIMLSARRISSACYLACVSKIAADIGILMHIYRALKTVYGILKQSGKKHIEETGKPLAIQHRKHRQNWEGHLERCGLAQRAIEEDHRIIRNQVNILLMEKICMKQIKEAAHMSYLKDPIR